MKARTKRKIIDGVIGVTTYLALYKAGAGLWAALIIPYSLWSYYDGLTRMELE